MNQAGTKVIHLIEALLDSGFVAKKQLSILNHLLLNGDTGLSEKGFDSEHRPKQIGGSTIEM
jgi:hypothetical protein